MIKLHTKKKTWNKIKSYIQTSVHSGIMHREIMSCAGQWVSGGAGGGLLVPLVPRVLIKSGPADSVSELSDVFVLQTTSSFKRKKKPQHKVKTRKKEGERGRRKMIGVCVCVGGGCCEVFILSSRHRERGMCGQRWKKKKNNKNDFLFLE